jgi:ethanolamine utilization microcompartment shell protein EutS
MVTLVSRFWEDLATAGRLAVVGGAALLLLVVGLLLRDEDDDVIWRLRSFVLLLSAGALGGFVGVLTVDALSWEGEPVAIAIGSAVALYGAALWRLKNRPAQQLTTLVGLIVAVFGVMYLLDGEAAVGLSVFAIGAVWLALGMQDRLPPALVATALGSIAVLVGPAVTAGTWEHAAPVMGLAVATGLVALGTWKHEFVLTGFGVIGLFGFLPWTLGALFGETAGPPVILLVSGVLLLAVMLLLLRARGDAGGSSGSGSGLAPPGSLLPH